MATSDQLSALETSLQKQIRSAHETAQSPLSPDDIGQIVRQVIGTLSGDVSSADLRFYAELEDLAAYIRKAKSEIASIQPKDISAEHIPQATDELDAVVGATEEATNKIMDICDEITAIAAQYPTEANEKLVNCTTRIFEACNFQDITGQRITKVVQALKNIDGKVSLLLAALGHHEGKGDGASAAKPAAPVDADKALLNGPALPGQGIAQDEIDRLLSGN